MKRRQGLATFFLLGLLLATSAYAGGNTMGIQGLMQAPPPAPWEPFSKIVPVPDFVPGFGTFFVNPKTMPNGPYLGYDRHGRLVNITYMIPIKDFTSKKDYAALGSNLSGAKIDHVTVTYMDAHPGMPIPHYHISLWLISRQMQSKLGR